MLAHLEPSAELTGGPWYTDKELDADFIKLLSEICLKIVRDLVSGSSEVAYDPMSRKVYYRVSRRPLKQRIVLSDGSTRLLTPPIRPLPKSWYVL